MHNAERNPEADAAEMRVSEADRFEIEQYNWQRANAGKYDNYVPDEPAPKPAKPAELATVPFNHSWPIELKEWREAYDAQDEAYSWLDALETRLAKARREGYIVAAEDTNTLRELATRAYALRKAINEAGSKVLAQWDEDNNDWRKPSAEPAKPQTAAVYACEDCGDGTFSGIEHASPSDYPGCPNCGRNAGVYIKFGGIPIAKAEPASSAPADDNSPTCAACGCDWRNPYTEIVIPGEGPYVGRRICGACFDKVYPEAAEPAKPQTAAVYACEDCGDGTFSGIEHANPSDYPGCPNCGRNAGVYIKFGGIPIAEPAPRNWWDGEKWVNIGPNPVCECGEVHPDTLSQPN